MKQALYKKYTFWAQFSFWMILFMLIFWGPELKAMSMKDRIVFVVIDLLRFAVLVYVNYLILIPRLMMKRAYKKYALSIALLMFLNLFFELWQYEQYPVKQSSVGFHLFFITLVNIFFLGITSLYKFVEFWFKNIRIKEQLRNQKLEAELNFLKTQINPHFLFNILNNIYILKVWLFGT